MPREIECGIVPQGPCRNHTPFGRRADPDRRGAGGPCPALRDDAGSADAGGGAPPPGAPPKGPSVDRYDPLAIVGGAVDAMALASQILVACIIDDVGFVLPW